MPECFWTNLTNAVCIGDEVPTIVTVDAISDSSGVIGTSGGFALTADSWLAGGTNLVTSGLTATADATITRIAGPILDDYFVVDLSALAHDLSGPALLVLPATVISSTDAYFIGDSGPLNTLLQDLTGSEFDNINNWYYIEVSVAGVGTFTASVFAESGT